MLAVVGIAAMIAFVFLGPLMQYMGGGQKVENPVVVETRFGDLTASELDILRYQRDIVDRFLQRVTIERVARQLGQPNIDSRWLTGLVDQQYTGIKRELMQRSQEGPEAAAVETMVLAERARQMGMVISDQAINDLIKQLTADSISATELRDIIRSLSPQSPVSVPRLFEALRTEMLASQYIRMFQVSLVDLPPAQRFEYFARLNRRAKAEVMPLAVADFISQVPDPQPAEVEAFYEKYKNDYADPASPEPGFKQPQRASFQYFKANLDQLTEQLKGEVTEEEIKKYYEENKRNFPALSLEDSAPAEGDAEAKPAAEGEAPAEKPATEEPAAETPAEEKPAKEPPAEEKPAEEKPAEPSPQSRTIRGAGQTFRLVSFAQDEQADSEALGDEQPAEDKPAEPPAAEPAAAPAEEKLADEQPAEEKPAEEAKPADAAPEEEPAADEPAEEKPAEPEMPAAAEQPAAAEGEPVAEQYEPLEKVADTIRGTLAREKAVARLYDQIEVLQAKMRSYGADYDRYTVERGLNPKLKAPAPLNLAELAKGTELQPLELQSVSPTQVADEDLGKSFRTIQNERGAQAIPFASFAYADSLLEYRPEVTQDNDNNVYLFWKTKEEQSFVPPLDQVRDEVVRAWKMIKARDLARKRAEEYAEQARSLSKPLAELFGSQPSLKVTETQPFSWLSFGNVPAQPGVPPRLSEVDGVSMAGNAFMKTVFGLNPGGVGVALNEPQDTVYVVRVIDFEPPLEELRDTFAREQQSQYLVAAGDDLRQATQQWIKDLNKEADVHWIRQADVRTETPEEEDL